MHGASRRPFGRLPASAHEGSADLSFFERTESKGKDASSSKEDATGVGTRPCSPLRSQAQALPAHHEQKLGNTIDLWKRCCHAEAARERLEAEVRCLWSERSAWVAERRALMAQLQMGGVSNALLRNSSPARSWSCQDAAAQLPNSPPPRANSLAERPTATPSSTLTVSCDRSASSFHDAGQAATQIRPEQTTAFEGFQSPRLIQRDAEIAQDPRCCQVGKAAEAFALTGHSALAAFKSSRETWTPSAFPKALRSEVLQAIPSPTRHRPHSVALRRMGRIQAPGFTEERNTSPCKLMGSHGFGLTSENVETESCRKVLQQSCRWRAELGRVHDLPDFVSSRLQKLRSQN